MYSLQFVVMSSLIWRHDVTSRNRTYKLVNRRRHLQLLRIRLYPEVMCKCNEVFYLNIGVACPQFICCIILLLICRSQWPRDLRRRSSAARLLRLWVRIPPEAWMFVVSVVCCQVEVSATDWSLVQRSPTDCGASLCAIKKPRKSEEAKARYWAVKIQPQWVVTPGKQQQQQQLLFLYIIIMINYLNSKTCFDFCSSSDCSRLIRIFDSLLYWYCRSLLGDVVWVVNRVACSLGVFLGLCFVCSFVWWAYRKSGDFFWWLFFIV